MSNKSYNDGTSNISSTFVKQDMILSDDEEESATLAEPMTVECAKQLAQSSTSSAPASIAHMLPAVSHSQLVVNTSIHNLNSLSHVRPAILHTLVASPPVTGSLHGVALDSSHLVVSPNITPLHSHNLWSTPNTSCADDDCNEIDNYPSTVDIEAIRDSPTSDRFSERLMTINENWNCQEEHCEENAADDDDGSDEDDTDMSDSDSSIASTSSVPATIKKPHKDEVQDSCRNQPFKFNRERSLSHSESANSKSESDSKESDIDSSDGSSSDEESSTSSMDDESNEYANNTSSQTLRSKSPIITKHTVQRSTCNGEQNKLIAREDVIKIPETSFSNPVEKILEYPIPVPLLRPYMTKPNVHSLISTDSKRQQKIEQRLKAEASINVLENTENLLKQVSISSNNFDNTKQLCNNAKNLRRTDESLTSNKIIKSDPCHKKEIEGSCKVEINTGKVNLKQEMKNDLKVKSCTNTVGALGFKLQVKRLEKKLEMDREFDRLLKSTNPIENVEKCDIKPVQKSSVKICVTNKEIENSDKNENEIISNKVHPHLIKIDLHEKTNEKLSQTKANTKMESKKSVRATSIKCKQPNSPKAAALYSSESQSSSLSSSDSDEITLLKTRKRIPSLMATAKIIPDPKSRKSKLVVCKETTPKVPISKLKFRNKAEQTEQLQSGVRATIADTVKVRGRRKSSNTDKISDVGESNNCESSSSEFDEVLNEKIDLDTEQTQTFSVSENNFNQGRLTLKIAAMKMAKFGKRGLKEVTKGGLPTLTRLSVISPKRSRLLALHGGHSSMDVPLQETHKVKTAAERKTYVDVLPISDGLARKKPAKCDMRVPASSLYRTSSYTTSLPISHNGPTSDDDDHISRIAHHLSQISHQHITDGLQVLDQEDLAAILPDVAPPIPTADSSTSSFDPFVEGHSQDGGSDLSDREMCSPLRNLAEMPGCVVRNTANSVALSSTTSLHINKVSKKCQESVKSQKLLSESKSENLIQSRRRSKINLSVQKFIHEEDNDHVIMPDLESFMPLDCHVSNVSPDSGIQSVNGSPLHHVGSPNHSPFYSSNIVSLSGSSVSTVYQPSSSGVNDEGGRAASNRSYSPNSSPQIYPSPPILLPAITPPHMTSSPRYYDRSPDSPQMPSLKCQVYPPPWDGTHRDEAASGSESGKESQPKRSRGRPKGSKNKRKDYNHCWVNDKVRKEKSFRDLSEMGKKDGNKEVDSNFECSPLKNNWRSSAVDPYDHPDLSLQPKKRGPGRPKKNPILNPESSLLSMIKSKSKIMQTEINDKLSQIKRPVGRPRKYPKSKLKVNSTPTPVTLASRKCFSEKIMHKIINEKVKNSEKSDKLEEFSQPEDFDKNLENNSKKTKKKRIISDGIPLVEEKKRKRGRRKELPAIFEKVYGCVHICVKSDKNKCTSPILFKKKKKKKKSFKTKHKNIVDPVFLAELEKLLGEFQKCHISKTYTAPQAKAGEVLLPTIFRFKKAAFNKKRRLVDKAKASDKESGTEGESSKEKISGKRKKKLLEAPKQGRERSEANEQRLPLKKRHRHISTAVPTCAELSKQDSSVKVCNETKDRSSASKSPLRSEPAKVVKSDSKSIKTMDSCNLLNSRRKVSSIEKSFCEDVSLKMLDQIVEVERVKEVTETSNESFIKQTSSQSMVATTPKKRHRIESDLNVINMNSRSDNYISPASICAATLNIPTDNTYNSKKNCLVNQPTIKEETDPFAKLISSNATSNKIDKPSSEELLDDGLSKAEVSCISDSLPCNEESSGTHSDSDIPSEHEPLCESDQSGFMSDKETTKDEEFKPVQKKLKKKKDIGSSKKDPISCKEEQSLLKTEPPVHRKKAKRRKTNKTGFPTIKKKKKKPKPEENIATDEQMSPEKAEVDNRVTKLNCNLEPKVCVKQLTLTETMQHILNTKNNETCKLNPRPRGRPRKDQSEPEKKTATPVEKIDYKKTDGSCNASTKVDMPPIHRLRKAIPTFRNCKKRDISSDSLVSVGDNKRLRRMADDEVDDSDVFMPSDYQPSSEPVSSDESSRHVNKQRAPRWRRKYLIAGLFSDYYKQDEPRRNGDMNGSKAKSNQETEPRTHSLLPAPLYCKKKLRETQRSFLLPYDLWWLHKHNMLPGRDTVASWNYKKVKSNVYYDVKSTFGLDVQSCNCKKPSKSDEKGCGEDCINRMMFIECNPQNCPVKDICTNQRLQRHENISCLKKFMTEEKGWGIKTSREIKQSCFIMEYVGEVVSEREFRHRMQTRYSNDKHHYCLNLDRGLMIDGHRIGSDCRFVNHSCNPNCEMQKWNVNGQYRMALFALTEIGVDEELTYDYNFHLFNPARGQECKCKTSICRGVIGGRSQRLNGQPVEEKKKTNGRNKKDFCRKRKRGVSIDTENSLIARSHFMPIKPLSHQQRSFLLAHRCFLVRNLEKIRKSRDRLVRYHEKKIEEEPEIAEEPCNKIQKFMTHFTALNTARSVKTRRLAQAEDDPEMTRIAKLAQIFKDIYDKLVASRDENEKPLATPFMTLFPKKKYPTYFSRVGEPIDLSIIEKNILTGNYTTVEGYDRDLMMLFANNLRFFGRNTEIGKMAMGLRKVYSECKLQFKPLLEEVLGEDHLPPAFASCTQNEEFEDEDVIRCVCNLYRDEGTMIQCEKCLVWQHCDCMGITEESFPEHYLCEECHPRVVSLEIPMTPQPSDSNNKKYFVTLLRDSLQIKQGDSVYILRDGPKQKPGERKQPAYKLAKDVKYHELLIFKVENLYIDNKGDKYAFGHHFLRPHETFHEPWRKFFPNEVIRSPFCEILPLDMIIQHCWVMDLNSYCRGKPIGAPDDHIYVCEYRVDKSARVFSKISKPKYLICKKPYAFIQYPEKLRPQRTYTPHEVIQNTKKPKPLSLPVEQNTVVNTNKETLADKIQTEIISGLPSRSNSGSRKTRSNNSSNERSSNEEKPSQPIVVNIRNKKRERVNMHATRLLKLLPTKGAVDLAFLLETGKRNRKKTAAFSS